MANILLIYPKPDEMKDSRFGFSLHLLYLSSILKQAGHIVTGYLDYSIEVRDDNKLYRQVKAAEVIIIEFDAFPLKRSLNIEHGEELIRYINQEFPAKRMIVSGYDFALFPRQLDGTTLTLTGEPEKNILEAVDIVLDKANAGAKPGIYPGGFLKNLDELPFPDRSILSSFAEAGGSIINQPDLARSTLVETSRGCLGSCSFCQRRGWRQGYRTHTVEYVLREFAQLAAADYKNIWISDDNFTCDLARAKNIFKCLIDRGYTAGRKIALSSWTKIDEEFLELAKAASISIISFGVESTDGEILKFYKKNIDPARFKDLIVLSNELGLYTVGNFIFGAPMESEATIEKTFTYIRETPFDRVNLKLLDYMAGSELFDSLPSHLKGNRRHIFACRENGLNNFPMNELQKKLNEFRQQFTTLREEQLKEKIRKYGPPYFTGKTAR